MTVIGAVVTMVAALQVATWLGAGPMVADVHAPSEMKVFLAAGATGEQQKALETKIASVQGVAAVTPKQVLDVRMSDPVSLAGSLLAVLSLNYVGNSLVPGLDSCVALVPCALPVRLPR